MRTVLPPSTVTSDPRGEPPPLDSAPPPTGPDRGTRDGLLIFVFGLAALALLAGVIATGLALRAEQEAERAGTGATSEAGGQAAPASVPVVLSDFAIRPERATVAQGGALQLTNNGAGAHDVAIEGTGLVSDLVGPGESGRLDLGGLEPGTYTMFCHVPGHREAGMVAELVVTPGRATGAAPADEADEPSLTPEHMDEMMAERTKAFPAATEGKGAQLLAPTVLADGTKRFDLAAKIVQWEIEPGKRVEAWTYNGTVPGPTIKVDPGDKVRVVLRNELPESTVVHFHGIELPNAMDGVPDITQPPVKPGQSFTYEFTAQATPAVAMYHSHHDAAKQVSNGLAGALLVGSEPVPAGVEVAAEHVMMLNDAGTIGFSLNGKSFPATEPIVAERNQWIQVHYMNEGVMAHPMHLHGLAQTVIAKDGYPVPQPYRADTVMVGPGERYTVLVQATVPGTWAWHCHILTHAEREDGMFGMVTALVVK